MADTKQSHGLSPVEGDGISYSGIFWFVVILAVVTVTCQILMWVLLQAMQAQTPDPALAASPLAPAVTERAAQAGGVYPDLVEIGKANGPTPRLLVQEPRNLELQRAREHDVLTTYGWADRNTGAVRIPIDRAKDLLIERGLPVRGADGKDGKAVKDVKAVTEVKK